MNVGEKEIEERKKEEKELYCNKLENRYIYIVRVRRAEKFSALPEREISWETIYQMYWAAGWICSIIIDSLCLSWLDWQLYNPLPHRIITIQFLCICYYTVTYYTSVFSFYLLFGILYLFSDLSFSVLLSFQFFKISSSYAFLLLNAWLERITVD